MSRFLIALALATLAGCATPAVDIEAQPVSADAYSGKSCQDLANQYAAADLELSKLSADQNAAHDGDVTGVMLVGLPIGSMTAKGSAEQRVKRIGELKGQKEAIILAKASSKCIG